ncbi:MAG: tellurium resistance protein TerC [Gammaproteobacteria bacterium]|nr:tellurium resistance protein TerC [Gammaproteobacteria bacterium]
MENLFTLGNLVDLCMLVMLQAVLGFDNLLYISLESRRAPAERQSYVRKMGIALAVIFRIILLIILVKLIALVQKPVAEINWDGVVEGTFNLHSIIVLFGGVFIIYTAIKEIWHMMNLEQDAVHDNSSKSVANVIMLIVVMNVVFSFDSILSAIALAGDNVVVMATAILIGGGLMIVLADGVTSFLEKNRMYEVLGLFILLVVGIMLLSEGGHIAHLEFFDKPITVMNKTTFYFVIVVMVLSDIVQSRYQKKLLMKKSRKVSVEA